MPPAFRLVDVIASVSATQSLLSGRHDCRVVINRPGLLEPGDGNLLIAAANDAAVVEVDNTCFGIYAGDNDEVVRGVPLAGPVPDGFGVE